MMSTQRCILSLGVSSHTCFTQVSDLDQAKLIRLPGESDFAATPTRPATRRRACSRSTSSLFIDLDQDDLDHYLAVLIIYDAFTPSPYRVPSERERPKRSHFAHDAGMSRLFNVWKLFPGEPHRCFLHQLEVSRVHVSTAQYFNRFDQFPSSSGATRKRAPWPLGHLLVPLECEIALGHGAPFVSLYLLPCPTSRLTARRHFVLRWF